MLTLNRDGRFKVSRESMHFVEIWSGQIPEDAAVLQCLSGFLDNRELDKAGTFKNLRMRNRYIAVRGLVRATLADYLGVRPATLQFIFGEYDKPALLGEQLHFNVSHTGNHLAIGVSDMQNIGVDIELHKTRNRLGELAKRTFTDQELNYWSGLVQSRQLPGFYQLWTKKEAFVKAVGRGIGLGLERCEVAVPEGLRFASIPPEYGLAEEWRIIEPCIPDYLSAALVFPERECIFKQFFLVDEF